MDFVNVYHDIGYFLDDESWSTRQTLFNCHGNLLIMTFEYIYFLDFTKNNFWRLFGRFPSTSI